MVARADEGPVHALRGVRERSPGAAAWSPPCSSWSGCSQPWSPGLRYRRDLAIAAALALVQIGSLVVVSAATSKSLALNITYSVWWAAPVGMWAWLVLGFSISRLWPAIRTRSGRAAEAVRTERAPAVLGVSGLLLVAAVAVAVAVDQPPGPHPIGLRAGACDGRSALREELPEGRAVQLGGPATRSGFWFLPAVAYGLRRKGFGPSSRASSPTRWGRTTGSMAVAPTTRC